MALLTCSALISHGDRMIRAQYFDGLSTRLHAVHLVPGEGHLHIQGEDLTRSVAVGDIRISEPFVNAPCILQLRDGAHCAVHPGDGRSALLAALGYRPSWVVRLQQYWKAALAGIASVLGLLVFSYFVLLPVLTDSIAARMPADTLHALGDKAEQTLQDKGILEFSILHTSVHDAVQHTFKRIKPAGEGYNYTLKIRSGKIGMNAGALPNGTIVVSDMLVAALADGVLKVSNGRFEPGVEERLAAVLAHEIAHLEKKHALRKLVRASLTSAGAWALYGDFSGVASMAPVVFGQAKYSREMETEADDRAIELLRAQGIAPVRLAETFEYMERFNRTLRGKKSAKQRSAPPEWMMKGAAYLSSHPATQDRILRIRSSAHE
jgi:Zn-dependent protease with chaperone function